MSALISAFAYYKLAILTIRGRAVGVVRVVVVQRTVGIHVAHVVRVRCIRRTQPPVTGIKANSSRLVNQP